MWGEVTQNMFWKNMKGMGWLNLMLNLLDPEKAQPPKYFEKTHCAQTCATAPRIILSEVLLQHKWLHQNTLNTFYKQEAFRRSQKTNSFQTALPNEPSQCLSPFQDHWQKPGTQILWNCHVQALLSPYSWTQDRTTKHNRPRQPQTHQSIFLLWLPESTQLTNKTCDLGTPRPPVWRSNRKPETPVLEMSQGHLYCRFDGLSRQQQQVDIKMPSQ